MRVRKQKLDTSRTEHSVKGIMVIVYFFKHSVDRLSEVLLDSSNDRRQSCRLNGEQKEAQLISKTTGTIYVLCDVLDHVGRSSAGRRKVSIHNARNANG